MGDAIVCMLFEAGNYFEAFVRGGLLMGGSWGWAARPSGLSRDRSLFSTIYLRVVEVRASPSLFLRLRAVFFLTWKLQVQLRPRVGQDQPGAAVRGAGVGAHRGCEGAEKVRLGVFLKAVCCFYAAKARSVRRPCGVRAAAFATS